MKIGLDIDGVIIDLVSVMLPYLSIECGYNVTHEDIRCYNIGEALGVETKIAGIMEEVYKSENLKKAPPIEGAIEGINRLSKGSVYLITTRPEKTRTDTEWWLDKHNIDYDELVFTTDRDKISIVRRFNVDIFVEDCLDHAISLSSSGVNTLLLDKSWNRDELVSNKYTRVYNWDDIVSSIEALNR